MILFVKVLMTYEILLPIDNSKNKKQLKTKNDIKCDYLFDLMVRFCFFILKSHSK
jgi:hypothetical protein